MNELEKNITNLFNKRGKQWLNALPTIMEYLANKWQLIHIQPVANMTWNYVAKAISKTHGAVVVKVSCDEKLIHDELIALKHFNAHGMIKLFEHDSQYHAMLLQQAIPGKSLRSIYPNRVQDTINIYSAIVKQLTSVQQQDHNNFKHVSNWLKVFDRTNENKLPDGLIEKADLLKNSLLASRGKEFVLHGDLHHDNILSDGNSWVAIDPKGIIGEIEFEAACFDFIHKSELGNANIPELFAARTKLLAKELSLDHERLKTWVLVRLILGACWAIEDRGNPDNFIRIYNAISAK